MASTWWNLRAVRDGSGGGHEATRMREAEGKKEGRRRKDCGMVLTGEQQGVASVTTSVRERECEMPSETGGGAMAGGQGWPDRD